MGWMEKMDHEVTSGHSTSGPGYHIMLLHQGVENAGWLEGIRKASKVPVEGKPAATRAGILRYTA